MIEQAVVGCVGNTIRTRSGRYLDLADPKPDQFTMQDIASGLSKICRFGGQLDQWYSVAEHSIHCSNHGRSFEIKKALLLHDASEAFIGDVVKPLKIMLPAYQEIEERLMAVILEKYGVDTSDETAMAVDMVDKTMLFAEKRYFFRGRAGLWPGEMKYPRVELDYRGLSTSEAESQFLKCARSLWGWTCSEMSR
jgi:hypothetical protein